MRPCVYLASALWKTAFSAWVHVQDDPRLPSRYFTSQLFIEVHRYQKVQFQTPRRERVIGSAGVRCLPTPPSHCQVLKFMLYRPGRQALVPINVCRWRREGGNGLVSSTRRYPRNLLRGGRRAFQFVAQGSLAAKHQKPGGQFKKKKIKAINGKNKRWFTGLKEKLKNRHLESRRN